MKDKWMNMGHEEDELKPFSEPEADLSDLKRIEMLVGMGYSRTEIEDSLKTQKYDDVFATYLLLGRRSTDVRCLTLHLKKKLVFTVNNCCFSFFSWRVTDPGQAARCLCGASLRGRTLLPLRPGRRLCPRRAIRLNRDRGQQRSL